MYDYNTYYTIVSAKGNTPTDLGYATNLSTFFINFMLLYFNVFNNCYFENTL